MRWILLSYSVTRPELHASSTPTATWKYKFLWCQKTAKPRTADLKEESPRVTQAVVEVTACVPHSSSNCASNSSSYIAEESLLRISSSCVVTWFATSWFASVFSLPLSSPPASNDLSPDSAFLRRWYSGRCYCDYQLISSWDGYEMCGFKLLGFDEEKIIQWAAAVDESELECVWHQSPFIWWENFYLFRLQL